MYRMHLHTAGFVYKWIVISEVGGVSSTLVAPKPGNRFRFCFVFVSCVRAGGRGEAAWAREGCGCASSTLGFRVRNSAAPLRHFFVFICWYTCGFYAIFAQKFLHDASKLVFFVWVLRVSESDSSRICCYTRGF